MNRRTVTLAVVAGLALAAQPAQAQRGGRPGGGHPGGGGHAGYGRAVPRGGSPGYVPGGVAHARHPRAGTGYAAYRSYPGHRPGYGHGGYRPPYYGHGGYYPRYYGGYYPRHYGGYYPRYYYPYYPYYGAGLGLYFGFGGPSVYGSVGYGWPYSYAPYAYGPSVTNVYPPPREQDTDVDRSADLQAEVPRAGDRYVPNTGRVRLEVRPDDATVYVDDEFWGTARESRFMTLRAGRHVIELVRPGFDVVRREVEVVEGETSDVLVELQRP
jgi:hypothetical protein